MTPSPPNPALIARRRAATALNTLCREADLGTMAVRFDAEQTEDWVVVDPGEVMALVNGREVARVFLEPPRATLVLYSPYGIVRAAHMVDFEPGAHGFKPQSRTGLGDLIPIIIELALPEEDERMEAPLQYRPRTPRVRAVTVKRSL